MPERIDLNFNTQGKELQGTGALGDVSNENLTQNLEAARQNVQGTKITDANNPENDLITVAYDENGSNSDTENNILDEIQNERTEALDKYLRYQEQILELQRQKSEYEEEIRLHQDNPDTVKRYQGKIEALDVEIAGLKEDIAECETLMQNLMTEFNTTLSNMINQSSAQSVQFGVPLAYSGNPLPSSNVVQTGSLPKTNYAASNNVASLGASTTGGNGVPAANYGTHTGEGIPKNVAGALDARLGAGFSKKCENVAGYLGCNVNDLLAMMYSESGLKTTARNKSSNAIGLIQFIPSTLNGNGYTTEQVASMNALQQLDVVADIFMKAKKMAGYGANEKIDGGTLYAINWLPAYAKRDVIVSNGEKYYSSGLDMNKDGSVTKADLSKRLQSKYNEMLRVI